MFQDIQAIPPNTPQAAAGHAPASPDDDEAYEDEDKYEDDQDRDDAILTLGTFFVIYNLIMPPVHAFIGLYMKLGFILHQLATVCTSRHQSAPLHPSARQPAPACSSQYQSAPVACISLHQSLPACTRLRQPQTCSTSSSC